MGHLARRLVLAAILGLAIMALPKLLSSADLFPTRPAVKEALPSRGVAPAEEATAFGTAAVETETEKVPLPVGYAVEKAVPTSEEEFVVVLSREGPYRVALLFALPLALALLAFLVAKLRLA
jgi:hypothetical protein